MPNVIVTPEFSIGGDLAALGARLVLRSLTVFSNQISVFRCLRGTEELSLARSRGKIARNRKNQCLQSPSVTNLGRFGLSPRGEAEDGARHKVLLHFCTEGRFLSAWLPHLGVVEHLLDGYC